MRPKAVKRSSSSSQYQVEAKLFKALADPHRLRLLSRIAASAPGICVCDLGNGMPLLQPTVSHHLKVLRKAGLVNSRRCATWMYYQLSGNAIKRLQRALVAISPRKARV